jgi:Rad3-related DNA helicase
LLEIGLEPTHKDIQKEANEGNLELAEKLKSRQEECRLLREERFKKEKDQQEKERKQQRLISDYGGWAILIGILVILVLLL